MTEEEDFNKRHAAYVKRMAVSKGYDSYKSALERGHSEEYAKKMFNERYNEYIARNLE